MRDGAAKRFDGGNVSTRIPLTTLRIDGGTQPREEINLTTVTEFADAMTDGATFPAVVAFFDGVEYWLADGFHRYHASRKVGLLDIEAEVIAGTRRDAVLHAVGANATHGQRRTNADKHRAVLTLLDDEEWGKWSDREIAKRCAVSDRFVSSLRTVRSDTPAPSERTYTDKHGNVGTMDTSRIGRSPNGSPVRSGAPTMVYPKSTHPTNRDISEAFTFAEIALSQLARIRADDPRRCEQLRRVQAWIESELEREEKAS
jgi:ParB/Sulfiredoxin domain